MLTARFCRRCDKVTTHRLIFLSSSEGTHEVWTCACLTQWKEPESDNHDSPDEPRIIDTPEDRAHRMREAYKLK